MVIPLLANQDVTPMLLSADSLSLFRPSNEDQCKRWTLLFTQLIHTMFHVVVHREVFVLISIF